MMKHDQFPLYGKDADKRRVGFSAMACAAVALAGCGGGGGGGAGTVAGTGTGTGLGTGTGDGGDGQAGTRSDSSITLKDEGTGDRTETVGEDIVPIDLGDFFDHRDGGDLTLGAMFSVDGSGLTFDSSTNILGGRLDTSDDVTITVTASDAASPADSTTHSFTIRANHIPVLASGSGSLSNTRATAGVPIAAIDVAAGFSDPDGADTLRFEVSADGSQLPAAGNGLRFDPSTNRIAGTIASEGSMMITATAIDTRDESIRVSATFTITVAPNSPPTVANPVADSVETVGELIDPVDLSGLFDDPEGRPLTITVEFGRADHGLTHNAGANRIEGTLSGSDDVAVTVTASDGVAASVSHSFTIRANDRPVESGTPLGDIAGTAGVALTPIDVAAGFSDADGSGTLRFEASLGDGTALGSDQGELRFDSDTNMITGTIASEGTRVITVTAIETRDDMGESLRVSTTFTVTVAANSQPTVATPVQDSVETVGELIDPVDLSGVFDDPEGQPLDITVDFGRADHGLTHNAGTNRIEGTLAGSEDVVVTVTAGDGVTDNVVDSFTITANQRPTLSATPLADVPGEFAGIEITPIDVTTGFTDPDGDDTLRFEAALQDGTALRTDEGELRFNPETNMISGTISSERTVEITVTAIDTRDENLTVQSTFSITAMPNGLPEVVAPVSDLVETVGADIDPIDLSGAFSDPEGQPLAITATFNHDNHGLTHDIQANRITGGLTGADDVVVTLTANDGFNATGVSQSFTIRANHRPVESATPLADVPGEFAGIEITPIDVTSGFTDPDGDDSLRFEAALQDGTALRPDEGELRFNPETNMISGTISSESTVEITVTAIDTRDENLTVQSTFSITAMPNGLPEVVAPVSDLVETVNDPITPIDLSRVFQDPEGQSVSIHVAFDRDGHGLTHSAQDDEIVGTLTGSDDVIVTLTANDRFNSGNVVTSFTITANDRPVQVRSNPLTDKSEVAGIGITPVDVSSGFTDPDGDGTLRFEATLADGTPLPAGGNGLRFNPATNMITGTIDTARTETITVTAIDDHGLRVESMFNIVAGENMAPTVSSPPQDRLETLGLRIDPIDLTGVFGDPEGQPLIITVEFDQNGNPGGHGLAHDPGSQVISGTLGGAHDVMVTVTADDGVSQPVTHQFTITANNQPRESAAPLGDISGLAGIGITPIDVTAGFLDQDGMGDLRFEATLADGTPLSSGWNGVRFSSTTNMISGTFEAEGTETITVTAIDTRDEEARVSTTFTITAAANSQLTVDDTALNGLNRVETVGEMITALDLSGVFDDPENQVVTIAVDFDQNGNPGGHGLTYNAQQGNEMITGTLTGSDDVVVTLTAGDGFNPDIRRMFTITANDRPMESANRLSDREVKRGIDIASIDVAGGFTDPDGDGTLRFEAYIDDGGSRTPLTTGGNGLRFDPATNMITGRINAEGIVNVVVVAIDEHGLRVESTFVITAGENSSPTVVIQVPDRTETVGEEIAPISLAGMFNDPEGQTLTITVDFDQNGRSNGHGLTYDPGSQMITGTLTGSDDVDVTVSADDNVAQPVTHRFTIVANDRPVVSGLSDRNEVAGIAIAPIDVTAGFSDADGIGTLRFEAEFADGTTLPATGTGLTFNANRISGTIDSARTETITVTAVDTLNQSFRVSTSFDIVAAVNSPPTVAIAVSDRIETVGEDITAIDLGSVFSDPEGQPLTITVVFDQNGSSTGHGLAHNPAGNRIEGTLRGADDVRVTLTAVDGFNTAAATQSFTITANDRPEESSTTPLRDVREVAGIAITPIDVRTGFSDADGIETLRFEAEFSDGTMLPTAGNGLTFDPSTHMISGTIDTARTERITVTAIDMRTNTRNEILDVSTTFDIVAQRNSQLTALFTLPDVVETVGEAISPIDLENLFEDPERQPVNIAVTFDRAQHGLTYDNTQGSRMITGTLTGSDDVVVTVSANDGFNMPGLSQSFTITANDTPTESVTPLADRTGIAGIAITTIDVAAGFHDNDGNGTLTFVATLRDGSQLSTVAGDLRFDPSTNEISGAIRDPGTVRIRATATDEHGESVTKDFSITVAPNLQLTVDNSVLTGLSVVETVGERIDDIDLSALFNDPESQNITIRVTYGRGGHGLAYNSTANRLEGTLTGSDDLVVTAHATDGHNAEVNGSFTITANDTPTESATPLADRTEVAGIAITSIDVAAGFHDIDGNGTLTFTATLQDGSPLSTVPGDLSFNSSTNVISGEVQSPRTVPIRATATDDHGESVTKDFSITVGPNLQLTVDDSVLAGLSVVETVDERIDNMDLGALFNDPESQNITIRVTYGRADHGLTYNSTANRIEGTLTGSDDFDVTAHATDGHNVEVSRTFTITANDKPVETADTPLVDKKEVADRPIKIIDVTDGFTDPDGDGTLTFDVTQADGSNLSSVGLSFDGTLLMGTIPGRQTVNLVATATDVHGESVSKAFSIEAGQVLDVTQRGGRDGDVELDLGSHDDLYYGYGGDDTVEAGFGDDTLIGGEGDDDLNGEEGDDTAEYQGKFWDFQISRHPTISGAYLVVDAYTGDGIDEGRDTLRGIETIRFGDGREILLDPDHIHSGDAPREIRTKQRDFEYFYGEGGGYRIFGNGIPKTAIIQILSADDSPASNPTTITRDTFSSRGGDRIGLANIEELKNLDPGRVGNMQHISNIVSNTPSSDFEIRIQNSLLIYDINDYVYYIGSGDAPDPIVTDVKVDVIAPRDGDQNYHGDSRTLDNTIEGGRGNDTIIADFIGADTGTVERNGDDTAVYAGDLLDFTIERDPFRAERIAVEDHDAADGIDEGRDELRFVEHIEFKGSDDTIDVEDIHLGENPGALTGDSDRNWFHGKDGGYQFTGGGGADVFQFLSPDDSTAANQTTITDFDGEAGDKLLLTFGDENSVRATTNNDVVTITSDQPTGFQLMLTNSPNFSASRDIVFLSRTVAGGDRDELLTGTPLSETFVGGAGHDTFRIAPNAGTDRITDFTVGEDVIEFKGVDESQITSAAVSGGDFVFTAPGLVLTLEGVTTDLRSGEDYIFTTI